MVRERVTDGAMPKTDGKVRKEQDGIEISCFMGHKVHEKELCHLTGFILVVVYKQCD